MKAKTLAVAAGALLALANCTPIESHGEFVPDAPYAQFQTFSFMKPENTPPGYQMSPRAATILQQMKPVIAATMERKGYHQVPDGTGDIIIAYGAGRRQVEEHIPLNRHIASILGEETEDRDFTEGGLVIDAYDKNNGQIWHGAAKTEIDPDKPNIDRLTNSVNAAMSKFPARPTPH